MSFRQVLAVIKLRRDLILFKISEQLDRLTNVIKPRMVQDLGRRCAFNRVKCENRFEEVHRIFRDFFFKCCLPLYNLFLQVCHVACLERDSAVKHGIEDNASRPDVGSIALVPFAFEDLGGNVRRSSALLHHDIARFS